MAKKIRIGVIGAGSIAEKGHIPGLQKVDDVEVVAICDTSEERAQALADQSSVPSVFTDYRAMLAEAKLDAVTLGVPNALHAPMALAAFEAGLHVFCEKPLATSVEDGRTMLAAAKKAGRVLALNMQFRTDPAHVFVHDFVRGGGLGKPGYTSARWFRQSGIPGFGSWFTRKELSGGGVLMDIGVHMLDAALWFSDFPDVAGVRGEVQTVHGSRQRGLGGWGVERHASGVFDVEDFAALHLRLRDGGLMSVEVSWAIFGGDEMRVQIAGSEGGVEVDAARLGSGTPVRVFAEDGGAITESTPALPKVPWIGWDATTRDFVEAIREGREPLATGEEGLKTLTVLCAGYESAATGREVQIAQ